MRTALLAAAALTLFALPAAADPVVIAPAAFSPAFQEKLDDDIGAREAGVLQRAVHAALARNLARAGATPAENAAVTVETTIVDARNNRPTFEQLSDRPGLSYIGSISTGGAELTGVIRDASGRELRRVTHRWYEPQLAWASPSEWGDARRAIDGFARKVARAYGEL